MKRATKVQVGQVIEFPHHCFDERRSGWNGWIFRAGIVQDFGTSKKTGKRLAKVLYCVRQAGRYQLLPNVEDTRWVPVERLFQYNLEFKVNMVREFLEAEKQGEEVCWDEDAALLVNHGLV